MGDDVLCIGLLGVFSISAGDSVIAEGGWRRVETDELVVEGEDLRPVGVADIAAEVCTALIAAGIW
ncbi:MAG: hypothetical protein WAU42_04165 [Solirubrobacteraceae bacterium]